MLAGTSSSLPLRLVNHGHADILLGLVISAVSYVLRTVMEGAHFGAHAGMVTTPLLYIFTLSPLSLSLFHPSPSPLFILTHPPTHRHLSLKLVCHLEMVQSLFQPSYIPVHPPVPPHSTSPCHPKRLQGCMHTPCSVRCPVRSDVI